jgi:hypothetical protein
MPYWKCQEPNCTYRIVFAGVTLLRDDVTLLDMRQASTDDPYAADPLQDPLTAFLCKQHSVPALPTTLRTFILCWQAAESETDPKERARVNCLLNASVQHLRIFHHFTDEQASSILGILPHARLGRKRKHPLPLMPGGGDGEEPADEATVDAEQSPAPPAAAAAARGATAGTVAARAGARTRKRSAEAGAAALPVSQPRPPKRPHRASANPPAATPPPAKASATARAAARTRPATARQPRVAAAAKPAPAAGAGAAGAAGKRRSRGEGGSESEDSVGEPLADEPVLEADEQVGGQDGCGDEGGAAGATGAHAAPEPGSRGGWVPVAWPAPAPGSPPPPVAPSADGGTFGAACGATRQSETGAGCNSTPEGAHAGPAAFPEPGSQPDACQHGGGVMFAAAGAEGATPPLSGNALVAEAAQLRAQEAKQRGHIAELRARNKSEGGLPQEWLLHAHVMYRALADLCACLRARLLVEQASRRNCAQSVRHAWRRSFGLALRYGPASLARSAGGGRVLCRASSQNVLVSCPAPTRRRLRAPRLKRRRAAFARASRRVRRCDSHPRARGAPAAQLAPFGTSREASWLLPCAQDMEESARAMARRASAAAEEARAGGE